MRRHVKIRRTLSSIVLIALGISALAVKAEEPKGAPVLHLSNGGFAPGELKDSDAPSTLRWQASPFVRPFDFEIKEVNAVHYPQPAVLPKPVGDYCFELSGGDIVYGTLVELDETKAVVDLPKIGRLRVDRSKLARIDRWKDGADLLYLGPNGLAGWTKVAEKKPTTPVIGRVMIAFNGPGNQPQPKAAEKPSEPEILWREESGHLLTDKPGAALRGDFKLPPKASVEFEVSWQTKPDFVLAFGVDGEEKSIEQAFRFEVWEGELVVLRETEKEADVSALQTIEPGAGRAHPHVYIDQEAGRVIVFSPDWKILADLKVANPSGKPLTSVYLANKSGDVRLEQLRIGKWNGEIPRELDAGKSRIHRADGSIIYGEVVTYDSTAKEYFVRDAVTGKESRIAEAEIASVLLSQPTDDPSRTFRAVYQDGSRFGGELLKVEKGALWLAAKGIDEPVKLPVDGLRSLVSLRRMEKTAAADADAPKPKIERRTFQDIGRPRLEAAAAPVVQERVQIKAAMVAPANNAAAVMIAPRLRSAQAPMPSPAPATAKSDGTGVLEMDGLKLPGQLADATEDTNASCLSWKPTGSLTASPLRPGVSGRIVYRTPTAVAAVAAPVMPQIQARRPAGPFVVAKAFLGIAMGGDTPPPTPPAPGERRSLYLRSGDIIPSSVTKIDENGVWFKTPMSESTFVPHNQVKAVELAKASASTVKLNKSKRDRLLTLPRMQRDSPPTQLIRSTNGDYLRGRVVDMDDKLLHVEVRLETKDVPRSRVARIIWLHPDELDATKALPPPERPGATRVQALRSDGIRLTFFADHFADKALAGKSDVLGACRVSLKEVDEFLFGKAIDQAAAQLAYQQWKLKNAVQPREGPADGGSGTAGTESALVGKAAPDFKLDMLAEGKVFRLSEHKGKVVVLDFWATWCGPCLQAMPQVDKVTREFKDQGVELVAVNLQETPKQIKAMLERHKLDMTVALDTDGSIAQKYKANAIPQTVIINRDGTVARLFVGGGPHFDDQLREALKAVLSGVKDDDKDKKAPAS